VGEFFADKLGAAETGDGMVRPVALDGAKDVGRFLDGRELGDKGLFEDDSIPVTFRGGAFLVHEVSPDLRARAGLGGIDGKFVEKVVLKVADGEPGGAGEFVHLRFLQFFFLKLREDVYVAVVLSDAGGVEDVEADLDRVFFGANPAGLDDQFELADSRSERGKDREAILAVGVDGENVRKAHFTAGFAHVFQESGKRA
jgi:hypothetical protein